MGEEKPDEELMGNVSLLRGCLRHFHAVDISMHRLDAKYTRFRKNIFRFFLQMNPIMVR